MTINELFNGIYLVDNKLATINLDIGHKVYNEELIHYNNNEYRLWNPYRSKLAAAILNKLKTVGIKKNLKILYIGSATGTTVSHVSDIIGKDGLVYCIELSERNMRQFLNSCENRENIIPILADARYTEKYEDIIEECDVLYQDVSSKDQTEILKKNSRFLKKNGIAYFIIKSQSIDISKDPKIIFENELNKLKQDFEIKEKINIEPYDKKHLFVVLKKL